MPVAMITGGVEGAGAGAGRGAGPAGLGSGAGRADRRALEATAKEVRAAVRDAGGGRFRGMSRTRRTGRSWSRPPGELGGLDLLVNNASALGAEPLVRLDAQPLEGLRRALETNVVAALGLVQEALPLLRASAAGAVVDVSSDAAVEAYATWGGYGASKAALDQLAAVLRWRSRGCGCGRWIRGTWARSCTRRRCRTTDGASAAARPRAVVPGVPAAAAGAAGQRPVRGSGAAGGAGGGGRGCAVSAVGAARRDEAGAPGRPGFARACGCRGAVGAGAGRAAGRGGTTYGCWWPRGAARCRTTPSGSCRGCCGPGTCWW